MDFHVCNHIFILQRNRIWLCDIFLEEILLFFSVVVSKTNISCSLFFWGGFL